MIKRQVVTKKIADLVSNQKKMISCLGSISRDIYHFVSEDNKKNCFFNMGAMGSVLPLGLGLSYCVKNKSFYVVEGDGSLIMNLGSLITFQRYSQNNLTLFILDNKQYETTGGQQSQPQNFELYNVIKSFNLRVKFIQEEMDLNTVIDQIRIKDNLYDIIVINTLADKVSPRINELPEVICSQFMCNLFN